MLNGSAHVDGVDLDLWHLHFKINTDERSFQCGFHVAQSTQANAKAVGLKLATFIKALLTTDCEIFYASMSRDDHARDSRYLQAGIGIGTFEAAATPPGLVNYSRDCQLFKLEDADGNAVTMKFAPMPDSQVVGGKFKVVPTAVVGTPVALPADPAPGDAYELIANGFYKAITFGTHHVKVGHAPGGVYSYQTWLNCYPLRIGSKKGGRVFI